MEYLQTENISQVISKVFSYVRESVSSRFFGSAKKEMVVKYGRMIVEHFDVEKQEDRYVVVSIPSQEKFDYKSLRIDVPKNEFSEFKAIEETVPRKKLEIQSLRIQIPNKPYGSIQIHEEVVNIF